MCDIVRYDISEQKLLNRTATANKERKVVGIVDILRRMAAYHVQYAQQ